MLRAQPASLARGYARSQALSAYPFLWLKAVGFWCPSIGRQAQRLYDMSGNGYVGVSSGVDNADWVDGPYGHAVSYGANEFYDCGDANNLFESQGRFSLFTWMRRNSSGSIVAIGKGTDSGLTKHIGIDLDATTVRFNLTDASDAWGKFTINDTAWHCYGFSFDGSGSGNSGRLKGYVDGREVSLSYTGTIPSATMGATSGVFRIGQIRINSVTSSSDGAIGDTFAWNRTLSPQEQLLLARGGSPLSPKTRAAQGYVAPTVGQPSIIRTKGFMPTGFGRVGRGW